MTPDLARVQPPPAVVDIARRLAAEGFETWCVGGAVRDALAGRANLDWDLATAARPQHVQRIFRRTVPVGIEFGTVGVLDRDGVLHEVTTFRRDVQHDGRHAVVEFGASLEDDLARRDFTINAIAFEPLKRQLYDPFDGARDLADGLLRAVGDPEARMLEDRLRALRAIRFAARFGMRYDPATWRAIVNSAPFLGRLSPERVKQELEKTMEQVDRPSTAFDRWRESGAFASLVPPLATVSDATLRAVDALPRRSLRGRPQRRSLRIAALFAEVGGAQTESALRALRFSNQDVSWIAALVDRWHRLGPALTAAMCAGALPVDGDLRRLAASVGRLRLAAFSRVAAAHWAALEQGAPEPRLVRSLHRRLLHMAFHEALEIADLAVDGDDLRSAGIPAGRAMGRILGALLDDVVNDPALNHRDVLLARASALAASADSASGEG